MRVESPIQLFFLVSEYNNNNSNNKSTGQVSKEQTLSFWRSCTLILESLAPVVLPPEIMFPWQPDKASCVPSNLLYSLNDK